MGDSRYQDARDSGGIPPIFAKHLDSRGDGSGVTAATGKYADATVTFTNATNVVNLATHGLAVGDGPFQFTTTGALPAELALLTDYFVGPTVAAGTFEVSLTRGGAAVTFTDDGSATTTIELPFRFYVEAQAGEILRIESLIVHVEDGVGFKPEDYGLLTAALTVGITVHTEDLAGATVLDLTDGVPVKSLGEWRKFGTSSLFGLAASDVSFQVQWIFLAKGVRLKLAEKFVVTCNDDLDGLVAHTFVAMGYDEAGVWGT